MTFKERIPLRDRLRRYVAINADTGCWEWEGSLYQDGYGKIKIRRKTRLVHTVMWELLVGTRDPNLVFDHRCRNRRCCNPGHLEEVTHCENIRRGQSGKHGNQARGDEHYKRRGLHKS